MRIASTMLLRAIILPLRFTLHAIFDQRMPNSGKSAGAERVAVNRLGRHFGSVELDRFRM
jgi:hypothetical protein